MELRASMEDFFKNPFNMETLFLHLLMRGKGTNVQLSLGSIRQPPWHPGGSFTAVVVVELQAAQN